MAPVDFGWKRKAKAYGPMIKSSRNRNLLGQLVFLGTGTSHGVPVIGCDCAVCNDPRPENARGRSSVVLGLPEGNLLIDTPPDMRSQLLREGIGRIHAVAYTHAHADHLFGLDDLRIFAHYLDADLPIYCTAEVEATIRQAFAYAFDPVARSYPAGGVPRLAFRRIDDEPFEVLGAQVVPIPLRHGRFDVRGYRIGDVAYCTDTNGIPPASMARLQDLDILVLDALRRRPHVAHFCLDEAIAVSRQLCPRATFFTHIAHELEHHETNAALTDGMQLAYDGLRVSLNGK